MTVAVTGFLLASRESVGGRGFLAGISLRAHTGGPVEGVVGQTERSGEGCGGKCRGRRGRW